MKRRIVTTRKKSSKSKFLSLSKKEYPKICIKRRLGGIGDILMSLPSLKAIKKYYPSANITYATDTKYMNGALVKVLEHSPYIDNIIGYKNIVDRGFDLIVDITSTGLEKEKSQNVPANRIDLFAKEIGIELLEDPIPEYIVTKEELSAAKTFIQETTKRNNKDIKIVLVQARASDVRRTWPLEYTQKLIDLLAKDDTYVILCDWRDDFNWKLNNNTILYNKEDIGLTAALIKASDLVICPDSSILHFAGSLLKPTVAIFGPIPPQSRCNHYPTVVPALVKLRCSWCWYTPKCKTDGTRYMECLRKLPVDAVYRKSIKLLNNKQEIPILETYGNNFTDKKTDNIVLVKRESAGIGDILMAANGIEKLKFRFPGKDIHVAVPKNIMAVLENNPYINKIINIESPINYKRYHSVLDISSPCAKYESIRVALGRDVQKSRVEVFAEALGTRSALTDLLPKFYLSDKEIEQGKEFIKSLKTNRKIVCVSTKSAEEYRNYNKEEDLIKLLKFKGFFPIILNKGTDVGGIVSCGDKTIREAASILNATSGIITVDTGWLHISAALNKNILAIFGPIDYKARCKQYNNIKVLIHESKCVPCWRNSEIKCKKTKTLNDSYCLSHISPNAIVKEAINFFKE